MPLIHGELRDSRTHKGIGGLEVRADFLTNGLDRLDRQSATSGPGGTFSIQFGSGLFAQLDADDSIVVQFEVFENGRPCTATGSIPDLQNHDAHVTIHVDPADEPGLLVVEGTISHQDGLPVPGVVVRATDRDLQSHTPLGEALTDVDGHYRIEYTHDQFRRAEKLSADLVVHVIGAEGDETLSSPTFFNAGSSQVIDLVVPSGILPGLTEYERYRRVLAPLVENLPVGDLTEEHLSFLAGETEIAFDRLRFLQLEDRWVREYDAPRPVLYGLLREGLPGELRTLLGEPRARLAQALVRAGDDGVIPTVGDDLDAVLDTLEELAVGLSLRAGESPEGAPRLGDLLKTAPVDDDQRREFARFALRHTGARDFWKRAAEKTTLDDRAIESIRFTMDTSELVFGHLPTLQLVQDQRRQRDWVAARDLVHLSGRDWNELIVAAQLDDLPGHFDDAGAYAEALADQVEQAFPGPFASQRLIEDQDLGTPDFARFTKANPGYDLFQDSASTFLANGADLSEIEDIDALRGELQLYGRIGRITTGHRKFEHLRTLILNGHTSGTRMALTMSEEQLTESLGEAGGSWTREAYSMAEDVLGLSGIRLLQVHDYVNTPRVMRDRVEDIDPWYLNEAPAEWAAIFGSAGGCACEHCRSVLGPAAYFTDLLRFLDKAPRGSGEPPLAELFDRRPDLQHLLLDCTNTNTVLPYIDLVNEILEDAVAALGEDGVPTGSPGPTIPGPGATAEELDAYRAAVVKYQTSSTDAPDAEEERKLRAVPEHDPDPGSRRAYLRQRYRAYHTLATAQFPWSLPYSRDHERARVLADYLGLEPHVVQQLFGRSADQVARSHLRMTEEEWQLVARPVSDPTELARAWGLDTLDPPTLDLDELRSAPILLAQAGISYPDLQDLVATTFLADADLEIHEGADACDIRDDRLLFTPDAAIVFDRIHRFVRLTRLLGWDIADLDSVLATLDIADIDARALRTISELIRLASELRLPVVDAASLDLPTLASHLRVPEDELRTVAELSATPPLGGPGTPLAIRQILTARGSIATSGIGVAEWKYLLTHRDLEPAVFEPLPDVRRTVLQSLHRSVAAELHGVDDERIDDVLATGLAEHLALDQATVVRLITDSAGPAVLRSLVDVAQPAAADLRTFAATAIDFTAEDLHAVSEFEVVDRLLVRLDKVSRLLRGMGVGAEALDRVERLRRAVPMGFDVLDLNDLPVEVAPPDAGLFEQAQALAGSADLARRLPRADQGLFQLMLFAHEPGRTVSEVLDNLAANTGWDRAALAELSDTGALGLDLAAFGRVATYDTLLEAIGLLRRWRVTVHDLVAWGDPATAPDQLLGSLTAVAERNAGARWLDVLTPMADRWREQQRDGLLDFLVTHRRSPGNGRLFTDRSAVYGYYLIDVEMSSCQLTSRIKQAAASVQQFVQRILLGLEPDIDPDFRSHWEEWEWRKNYRVWEAARKVFIHPENWLEPDLRDNKSPLFKALENELLQDEVTPASVDAAYLTYLAGLDELTGLDVRALYNEEDGGRTTLHVFARTHSEPYSYYYRRRDFTGVWTAWDRLDLRIDGDHLIPAVRNGRLMLFWVTFRSSQTGREEDGDPKTYWDLFIHWSELRNGRWTAPQGGDSVPLLRLDRGSLYFREPSLLSFRSNADADLSGFVNFGFEFARFTFDGYAQVLRLDSELVHHRLSHVLGNAWWQNQQLRITGRLSVPILQVEELNSPAGVSPLVIERPSSPDLYLDRTFGAEEWDFPSGYWDWVFDTITWYREERYRQNPILRQVAQVEKCLVPDVQHLHVTGETPLLATLDGRQLLVTPRDRMLTLESPLGPMTIKVGTNYRFERFDHPYVRELLEAADRGGVTALLDPPAGSPLDRQRHLEPIPTAFHTFDPGDAVPESLWPRDSYDFSTTGSMSLYNWEIFFHIPLLIAVRLSSSGRFEEAHQWFEYLFDPADRSAEMTGPRTHPEYRAGPARYFRTKPLFQELRDPPESIEDLLRGLAAGDDELDEQLRVWRNDPFNPHAIARLRLFAYMKSLVMKYLDNLIAWADDLFARDTIESINEATQLYVRAAQILGERPPTLEREEDSAAQTFGLVRAHLDEFTNLLVSLETDAAATPDRTRYVAGGPVPDLILYFCIPSNTKLAGYWDTVADRLFKIRHCMSIEGRTRALALFEPTIDPALLVRARAAGLDLREVIAEVGAALLPAYRYTYTHAKAAELCEAVRAFGGALLSALEKQDAERLGALRAVNEIEILDQMRLAKEKHIEEAEEMLAALQESKKQAEQRLDYYSRREYRNAAETQQVEQLETAQQWENLAQSLQMAAAIASAIPDIAAGMASAVHYGGTHMGNAIRAKAGAFQGLASRAAYEAGQASLKGGHDRRHDEWVFQAELAATDVTQIDRQIEAATIRRDLAERELATHDTQTEQAREVEDFLRTKFTDEELYGWMSSQLMSMHYQAYRLARDVALRAERAAQYELGVEPSDFSHIRRDHWDSGRKGLLAGDRLQQDLRRLDVAYMERNEREYEITKYVSLAMLDPLQLLELRQTGSCTFRIPEVLYDLDFPGQYFRRIKSVSLTIPCVTGPFTSISAKLSLTDHRTRRTVPTVADLGTPPPPDVPPVLPHHPLDHDGFASIATSTGRSDAGLFELSFRDERYLPFEGVGAISGWKLELPGPYHAFDYETITDVIVHVQYTARDARDRGAYAHLVRTRIQDAVNTMVESDRATGLFAMFSAKHDFPDEWHRFLHGRIDTEHPAQRLVFGLTQRHFPSIFSQAASRSVGAGIQITGMMLFLQPSSGVSYEDSAPLGCDLTPPDGSTIEGITWTRSGSPIEDLPYAAPVTGGEHTLGRWVIGVTPDDVPASLGHEVDLGGGPIRRLDPSSLDDLVLVCQYSVPPS